MKGLKHNFKVNANVDQPVHKNRPHPLCDHRLLRHVVRVWLQELFVFSKQLGVLINIVNNFSVRIFNVSNVNVHVVLQFAKERMFESLRRRDSRLRVQI